MSYTLHSLPSTEGRSKRRVGRGNSSGRGTYSGRGMKGQRSRSGGRKGLQTRALKSLFEKLPKRSRLKSHQNVDIVTLAELNRHFSAGATVTPSALRKKGLAAPKHDVKVLANGTVDHALTIKDCNVSGAAKERIEAAGGSVTAKK